VCAQSYKTSDKCTICPHCDGCMRAYAIRSLDPQPSLFAAFTSIFSRNVRAPSANSPRFHSRTIEIFFNRAIAKVSSPPHPADMRSFPRESFANVRFGLCRIAPPRIRKTVDTSDAKKGGPRHALSAQSIDEPLPSVILTRHLPLPP